MTGSHLSEASLNDYTEGRLAGAGLARVEEHLAECVRCRVAANRLSALLEQLHELPCELDPALDLLPSIRAETQRQRARRERRWPRATVAAAAAALIVAGATFTALAVRSASDGGAADRAADAVVATGDGGTPQRLDAGTTEDGAPLDEIRRLEAEYARATDELLAAFREERDRLGDGTVRIIEENIRTVDRALRQSRQALSTDPHSPVLRELVLAVHRQRLDVVRRAAVVAGGT